MLPPPTRRRPKQVLCGVHALLAHSVRARLAVLVCVAAAHRMENTTQQATLQTAFTERRAFHSYLFAIAARTLGVGAPVGSIQAVLHDGTACFAAWLLAYGLRYDFTFGTTEWGEIEQTLFWVAPLQAFVLWRSGIHGGFWRYFGLTDLKRILKAVTVTALILPVALFMLRLEGTVPRSVFLLDPILLTLMMGGSRCAYRALHERVRNPLGRPIEPVLVLGAGDAGMKLVHALSQSKVWRIVGILDDDKRKHGRKLGGFEVLGSLAELPTLAERMGVRHAVLAMPSASHEVRRRTADLCASAKLTFLSVPSLDDLLRGKVTISQIKAVDVNDLLRRPPVCLDTAGPRQLLTGQTVMVTGAGGSIGSELCRQIAAFEPRCILLFEQNELALYRMEQEFSESFPDVHVQCVIGDVKDAARVDQVMRSYRPSVVFHAAAYKHVPLMECLNSWEAVRNNVFGTRVIAEAARRHDVRKFVLISTDKAVNPTNVMGTTKRLAEMVCQAVQQGSSTEFVIVRFGNVLGSTGSVIPKFQAQIQKGGPVTVTHPEITRYFMSISEAAQLVLRAGYIGQGGQILVLDMGEPVRIADLARDMIRFSGFSEDEIQIVYEGLRPGEKLYEELLADDEHTLPTSHSKVRIAQARTATGVLEDLDALLQPGIPRSDEGVRRMLMRLVPEYTPARHGATGTADSSGVFHPTSSDVAETQPLPRIKPHRRDPLHASKVSAS